ncbi:MAG: hypothetical protein OS112_01430 [Methanoregula sp.]|nr:MAG: hypothetical protein OS112_01430 [Methanoregula sp.]
MENNEIGNQDVAEPDQVVSGTAGTGQENEELRWMNRHVPPDHKMAGQKTEVIGLVVLYKKPVNAGRSQDPADCAVKSGQEHLPEFSGDLIFSLYERQERIAQRLNKKIERLDRRITALEGRGRD